MSEYDPSAAPPPPPIPSGVPQEEKTLALVAHLLGAVTMFVGALIVWLISKDSTPAKPFATEQAKEALNFEITIAIAWVVAVVLATITLGLLFFLPPLVLAVNVVFCIIAAVKVNDGVGYRYPFALRLIK